MTDELLEFAEQVANHLPDGWRVADEQPGGRGVRLEGPGGARLRVAPGGYGGFDPDADRVQVDGVWPELVRDGHRHAHFFIPHDGDIHITATASRGPEAVAGDVARRLLPQYLPRLREAQERKAAYLAREEARRAALEGLAEAAGGLGEVRAEAVQLSGGGLFGHATVNVRVDSSATMDLELRSVPLDAALALMQVLREAGR
jgi:hypothetical protein